MNLLHDRRGIGRYARALIGHWLKVPPDVLKITLLVPHVFYFTVRGRLNRILGASNFAIASRGSVRSLRPHVVWYPWNGMTWVAPGLKVATVHDVWPFVSPAEDPRKRATEQTAFLRTAAHAAAIFASSAFTKSEIVKYLHVDPNIVRIVPLGVTPPTSAPPPPPLLDGVQRYVLFVGETEERKDVETLQAAMRKLPERLRLTTGLVIIGKLMGGQQPRGRLDMSKDGVVAVARFEPADSVLTVATGAVSDKVLEQFYGGAAVFVFPSRYEGFGLPVLEAMSYGIPVIASSATSIPEAGGDAALYFSPGDADALAVMLQTVLTEEPLARQLASAGKVRAEEMNWSLCADRTMAVMREVAGRP